MDQHTMTRDEFEAWMEQNLEEVLDRMNQQPRSLGGWTKSFAQTLLAIAGDQAHEDDDSIDGAFGAGDHVGGIFGDEEF